jgi:hypothetical protein
MHSEDTAKVINHRHGHCWRGTDRATHSRRHRGGRPGCDRGRDLLVLIGAPADGQKVLLAVTAMGGESAPRPGARLVRTLQYRWHCRPAAPSYRRSPRQPDRGRQRWQTIVLTLRPAILDCANRIYHVLVALMVDFILALGVIVLVMMLASTLVHAAEGAPVGPPTMGDQQ